MHTDSSVVRSSSVSYIFILILFFISGFAALLYQVSWQRMLAVFSGVDTFSVTISVAAFMGGLGLGSLAGGYLSDRLTIRRCLLFFALCEFIICVFAVVSKWLYYDVFYMKFNYIAGYPAAMAVVLFLGLLVPTFVMGMTLPLLSRALIGRIEHAASTIGSLYGINTLGSALGAFITGWILLRFFGFQTSIYIGAGLSLICSAGAFIVSFRNENAESRILERSYPELRQNKGSETTKRIPFPFWVSIYALPGLIALSLEMLWFRLLDVMLKSTSFTFSTILAVFLLGLASGTLVGTRLVKRCVDPARSFFLCQGGIIIYAALSFVCLLYLLGATSFTQGFWAYLGSLETVKVNEVFEALSGKGSVDAGAVIWLAVVVYFIIPLVLIAPATFLMGLSFTYLQKAAQRDHELLGRRVGWLQTANIAGSVMGTFLAGWVFFDIFGSTGTFRLLLVLGSVFLVLWAWRMNGLGRKIRLLAAAAVVIVSVILIPTPSVLWSKLHGTREPVVFAEDSTGLTVLKPGPELDGGIRKNSLYINGFLQSWLPYGHTHTLLGLIPAMLHPNPRDIVVIGLGSGDTAFSIGGREEIRSIRCFELLKHQRGLLADFSLGYGYGGLNAVLEDPRLKLEIADGRSRLKQEGKKYDIIEADTFRPHNSYAGNFFSYEYFMLARENLKPGGYVVSWVPTLRTLKTFVKAFPYVLQFDNVIIGSNEPIVFDREAVMARLRSPYTKAYYARALIDPEEFARAVFEKEPRAFGPDFAREKIKDINTDLHPRDEFLLAPR